MYVFLQLNFLYILLNKIGYITAYFQAFGIVSGYASFPPNTAN
jgi:hypothetical protein